MYWVFYVIIGATIPDGWPIFRANQQRTGYVAGYSCFNDSATKKWDLIIQNSENDLIFSSPVSADFNGDSKNDVIIGSWYSSFPTADLYRGDDGTFLWSSDYNGGPQFATPSLMEITGDGIPEVFLHEQISRFRALNGSNGTGVWVNSTISYSIYSASLVLESTTGTVIVGGGNTLWSLDATIGNPNWSVPVDSYIQPVSYGDVDGDFNPEIVVVGGRKLYVFDITGGTPKWEIDMGDSATTPALANLDSDSELEITVYSYTTGRIKSYNFGNATPFIDVLVGVWTADFTVGGTQPFMVWSPSPGLADITGDGVIDIVIHNGTTLYCVNGATHIVEWSNPARHLFGSPVIANLDNDDSLEIIVTGQPSDQNYRCKVECFEHTGATKWEWRSPIGSSGYPDPSLNEACLTDVDADGFLEIVAVDYSCYLVCLDCEGAGIEENTNGYEKMTLLTHIVRDRIELLLPIVECVEYKIYNICGRSVCTGKGISRGNKLSIDISSLMRGIYFLKVNLSHKTHTFKVVKVL